MTDDRIRISWDDVSASGVDDLLQQQRAWARSAQHAPAPSPPPIELGTPTGRAIPRFSLVSNSSIYLGLFGLVSAFVAWIGGELIFASYTNPTIEYDEVMRQVQQITDNVQRGEIGEAEGSQRIESLATAHQSNPFLQILRDQNTTDQAKDALFTSRMATAALATFLQSLIFYVFAASVLGLSLSIAEPVMAQNRRAAIVNGSVGLVAGLSGGLLVGLFIDVLYRAMGGSVSQHMGQQMLARTVGWGILGAFLSIGPGIVLRNVKRMGIGVIGGLIGGLLGGMLFDPLGRLTGLDSASRLVVLLAIGGLTGAATGLLEHAVKTGWLRVTHGLIAGKQFVLYRKSTVIGSSPECDVYLFKDPQIAPRHAAVELIPGGFELADLNSTSGTFVNGQAIQHSRLRNGDHIQIGGTCFTFQERATAKNN